MFVNDGERLVSEAAKTYVQKIRESYTTFVYDCGVVEAES